MVRAGTGGGVWAMDKKRTQLSTHTHTPYTQKTYQHVHQCLAGPCLEWRPLLYIAGKRRDVLVVLGAGNVLDVRGSSSSRAPSTCCSCW